MSLMDIVSGRRHHFNSVITPTFNAIRDNVDNAIKDNISNDKKTLKKLIIFLLYSSFFVIDAMFGEKGYRKEYLKLIDRIKTQQLLAVLYTVMYILITKSNYYVKHLGYGITETEICTIFIKLFDSDELAFKLDSKDMSNRDNTAKIIWLIDKIYSIILKSKKERAVKQQTQDMVFMGPTLANGIKLAYEFVSKDNIS